MRLYGVRTERITGKAVNVFNVDDDEIDLDLSVVLPEMNVNRAGAAYGLLTKRMNERKSRVMIYAVGGRGNEDGTIFANTTEILTIEIEQKMTIK